MTEIASLSQDDLKRRVNTAVMRNDMPAAEIALTEIHRRAPGDVETILRLTAVRKAQGARFLAVESARAGIRAAPKDARAHSSLAGALRAVGRFTEACAEYEASLAIAPRDPGVLTAYGETLERLRRTEDARAAVKRAIAADAHFGPAYNLMGHIASVEGEDDLAEKWLTRAIGASMQPEVRSTAWHRVGAIRERAERWDDAFHCHTTANRLLMDIPAVQAMRARPVFHMLPHQFLEGDAPVLARWAEREFTDGRPDPVFLVGFPRSGTTLTENVLAAIPGAATSDEEPVLNSAMRMAVRMCGSPKPPDLPAALDALTHDQLVELRAEYWRSVAALVSPEAAAAPVFIDKTPLRFIHLLYMHLLFPRSRTIFVMRDPRDSCLSCYFQDFALNPVLARFLTLDTTGETYAEAMMFWIRARSRATIPWMEVRYEDITADLETQARRLLEFLGQPWSDDVLRFQDSAAQRAIRTPSYHAVTRQVTTSAIGKWKHYEKHLAPLRQRIDRLVPELGYAPSDA